MIEVIATLKRKDGISPESFHYHWREKHPEVVLDGPSDMPTFRKYVQNHALPSEYEDGEPPADGVAQAWFDSAQELREWFNHPYYKYEVQADEKKFIDAEGTEFFVAQDVAMDVNPVDEEMVKYVTPQIRHERRWQPASRNREDEAGRWQDYVEHYVQHPILSDHVLTKPADGAEGTRESRYEGFSTLWFDDHEAFSEWVEEGGFSDSDEGATENDQYYLPTTHEVVI